MRFSTVACTLFGAAASVSASTLFARQDATLPNCAVPCTMSADLGGCVISDTHCLCTSSAFVSSTTACIEKACSGSDLQQALSYSQGLCLKVGVTLTASSTPAASATSGASNSSSASQTSSGASTTPTSPSGSASAPAASNTTSSSAVSHGVNAVLGLAAAGLLSLAL